MGEVLIGLVFFAIYFLPSIIGYNHKNANAICLLNLFLGWTAIGWIVAIVWAVSNDSNKVVVDNIKNGKSTAEQIVLLKELLRDGTLTKEEFELEKGKILKK